MFENNETDSLFFLKGGWGIIKKFDATYVAFLLLESLYASKHINAKTYQNILKKKNEYIEKTIKEKNKEPPLKVA